MRDDSEAETDSTGLAPIHLRFSRPCDINCLNTLVS